jgi:hypothetical protein
VILFHNTAPFENAGLLFYAMFYARTDTALDLMMIIKLQFLLCNFIFFVQRILVSLFQNVITLAPSYLVVSIIVKMSTIF